MERVPPTPQPISLAELVAAIAAVSFGLLAAAGLASSISAGRLAATRAPVLVTRALADDATCANAPRDPLAMRLGRARTYPRPIDIALEPAPFSTEPRIAGDDAYKRTGERLSGCETEEVLAIYTSTSPAYDHVLSWVLVSTLACPTAVVMPSGADGSSRQCISVSPVDATTGAVMGTRSFQMPQ